MRYLENKTALNRALERLNWPISLKELSMLENEILAGKMYIQQAMELQEAAKKENHVSKSQGEVGAMEVSTCPPSFLSHVIAIPAQACLLPLPVPSTWISKS